MGIHPVPGSQRRHRRGVFDFPKPSAVEAEDESARVGSGHISAPVVGGQEIKTSREAVEEARGARLTKGRLRAKGR